MNREKVQNVMNELDKLKKELQLALWLEDGFTIYATTEEEGTMIGYVDPLMGGASICLIDSTEVEGNPTTEEKAKAICQCLNRLNPMHYKWDVNFVGNIPWEILPQEFQKIDQVYNVNKEKEIPLENLKIILEG